MAGIAAVVHFVETEKRETTTILFDKKIRSLRGGLKIEPMPAHFPLTRHVSGDPGTSSWMRTPWGGGGRPSGPGGSRRWRKTDRTGMPLRGGKTRKRRMKKGARIGWGSSFWRVTPRRSLSSRWVECRERTPRRPEMKGKKEKPCDYFLGMRYFTESWLNIFRQKKKKIFEFIDADVR